MKRFVTIILLFTSSILFADDWGGDFRLRYTNINDIPTNKSGLNFDQGFTRARTRVWGQLQPDKDVKLYLRLGNEFRIYDNDVNPPKNEVWDPISEFIAEELYVDFNNLLDGKLDLRIGRQNLIYGTGNLILDGTPLDGSRTIYFNAIKATVKLSTASSIDLLGIFNKADDELAINSQDIKIVEQDETALGFYGKYSKIFEYYYIYKQEDERITRPEVKFHTVGVRVTPKINQQFSGNFELAMQSGERNNIDIYGTLFDGSLSYMFTNINQFKPSVSLGYNFMSGDDSNTTDKNEAWHQLFGRWPQSSELYVYSYVGTDYSIGGWGNLSAPYIDLKSQILPDVKLQLRYTKLYADEKDGLGLGDERGDLITMSFKVKFNKQLSGHIRGEWLNPGDYYPVNTNNAQFLRFNVNYKF